MTNNSVTTLLHRQLTDQLDSADRQLLIDWLANSSQNVKEQQDISRVWEMSGNYSPPFEPDVEKSFEKFSQRLKTEVPTQQAAKVLPLNPIKSWMKYAAVAAILIGAIAVWQVSSSVNVNQMMVSTIDNEVKAIDLADGTKVWVNEKSSFSYPDKFINGQRVVNLEGQAFFDVAENAKKPFIIKGGEANVKVLGTSFSFDTENSDGLMEVEVKEGVVSIIPDGSSESLEVTRSEKGMYDVENKMFLPKEQIEAVNVDFFVSNKYRFVDSKYTFVFKVLENVYDVEFEFANEGLSNCTFTSPIEFDKDDIKSTFDVIEAVYKNRNLEITQTGEKKYLISADSCE